MEQEIIQTEYKKKMEGYSELHNFFFREHGLVLLNEQMDEICKAVDCFKAKFNGERL